MLRMTKRKSRILAGLMAFVLVFSNIAANVQTVYATGIATPSNGTMLPSPVQNDDDTAEQAPAQETTAPAETEAAGTEPEEPVTADDEYALVLDILPKAETDAETGRAVWNGGWDAYDYSELGQTLLQDSEYSALAGELTGSWSSDDTDVLAMRANGDARVKAPGYATVTFTYEAPEAEPEVIADEAVVDEAVIDEAAADEDTDEADGTAAEEQPEAEDEADAGSDEEPVDEATPQNADKPEEVSADAEEEVAPSETPEAPANEENAPEPEAEEEPQEENEPAAAEDTEDEYPMADGTELSWAVKVESSRVTVYSDEPYNDVMQLAVEAGDEIADFGESHLEAMQEEPPYGVNVTLPDGGAWKSLDEDVVYLTLDGGMTVNVDDGACQIAYSYTVDGELYVALWDVTIGVGTELMNTTYNHVNNHGRLTELWGAWGSDKQGISTLAIDGNIAYCLQRHAELPGNDSEYDSKNTSGTSYNDLTADQLALIALIIEKGWHGAVPTTSKRYSVSLKGGTNQWYDTDNDWLMNMCNKTDYHKALATEVLVWEVTWGQRDLETFAENGAAGLIEISDNWKCLNYSHSDGGHSSKNKFPYGNSVKPGVVAQYNSIVTAVKAELAQESTLQLTQTDTSITSDGAGSYTATVTFTANQNLTGYELDTANSDPAITGATVSGTTVTITANNIPQGNATYNFSLKKPADVSGIVIWTDSKYQNIITKWDNVQRAKKATGSFSVTTNDFAPTPATWTPQITKVVTVNNNDTDTVNEQEFTFTLTPVNGAPGISQIKTIKGPGTVTFEPIEFKEAKTYVYKVNESGPAPYGFTYDTVERTVSVTVAKDNDKNSLYVEEEVWTGGGKKTFTNDYIVHPTQWTPKVKKKIEAPADADCENDQFTFTLTLTAGKSGGVKVNNVEQKLGKISDVSVTGANEASFPEITFTKEGVYSFTINETGMPENGYTPNTETKEIKVTVTAGPGGNLGAMPDNSGTNNTYTFTNKYDYGTVTYTPEVTKKVSTTHNRPVDKIFTFTMTDENDPKVLTEGSITTTVTVPAGNGDTEVTGEFATIKFEKPGTYNFTIAEVSEAENNPGYTYSTEVYHVTVVVTENHAAGRLDTAVTVKNSSEEDAPSIEFTNTYKPLPTHVELKVKKLIDAAAEQGGYTYPEDTTFRFILEQDLRISLNRFSLGRVVENQTVTLKANEVEEDRGVKEGTREGDVSFAPLQYEKAGTYKYRIREEKGDTAGFTYDSTIWLVTVEVTDNDGQLEPKVTYTHGDTGNSDAAEFTNTYDTEATAYTPQVTKAILGSTTALDKNFTFNLKDITAADSQWSDSVTMTLKAGETAGSANFKTIIYVKPGTYKYQITEVKPENAETAYKGYSFDDAIWTLTVKVKDTGNALIVDSAEYEAVGKTTNGLSADFANEYHVTETKLNAGIKKTVEGDDRPAGQEYKFLFDITQADDQKGATLPDETEITVVIRSDEGSENSGRFGDITFTAAGTYTFEIAEKDNGIPGYTYDTEPYVMTVEVVDNDSQLEVTDVSFTKGGQEVTVEPMTNEIDNTKQFETVFTNVYTVVPVEYAPKVTKEVTGEIRPEHKYFHFTLEAAEDYGDSLTMPEKTTAEVLGTANGSVTTDSFGEITFNKAGTYEFRIEETNDSLPGYTYDKNVWTLTLVVSDHASELKVDSITYATKDTVTNEDITLVGETAAAEFVNDYQVKPTVYGPEVVKTITGMPLWDETFEFELAASADNTEGGAEFSGAESARKVTVTGAGTAKFDDITFKKAGTYTFTVKETAGNSPYWTYDDRSWTLTVVVEDEDSQLVVKSHSYTSNRPTPDTSETAAEFENGFTAPGELRISKTVTGNAGEVRRDFHFTVTLTDLSGNPLKGSYSYTGSSIYGSEDAPADGVITDGVVTVTLRHGQEITFHDIPAGAGYRVEEAEADTEGYRTTVTVDGNGQAAAAAEGTIPIEGTSVVEYENYRYQPTGGTTPDRPGTNIPDNEVPQSPGTPDIITISDEPTPLSNFETIEDEDVPLAFLAPMTGDNRPVGAAALFGLLALGMMGAFGILASKKDEEDA